jgi:hypothetical protein
MAGQRWWSAAVWPRWRIKQVATVKLHSSQRTKMRLANRWRHRRIFCPLISPQYGCGLRRRCAVWINEDAAALGAAAILIDRDCKLRYRI